MSQEEKKQEKNIDAALNCFSSLSEAIQQAGGSVISWRELKDIKLIDLFYILGTNSINFIYEKDSKGINDK